MYPFSTRIFRTTALAILLALAAGCGDDDPVTPRPTWPGVVKITVDETAFGFNGRLGYVFTSLVDGTVIDEGTWAGPDILELRIPETPGEGFWVTHVQEDFYGYVTISTTRHSATGANEIDLRQPRIEEPTETAKLEFLNIPTHDHYVLMSGLRTWSDRQLPASMQLHLHVEPMDLLLILEGPTTPRSYLWTPAVTFDSVHVVDLVGLKPMARTSIGLPATSTGLRCNVSGYLDSAAAGERLLFFLDDIILPAPATGAWEFGFPDTGFDGYSLACYEDAYSVPGRNAMVITTGGLPGTLAFWDLEISVPAPDRDGCLVEVSSPGGRLETVWTPTGNSDQSWNVSVPETTQEILLPRLPAGLVQRLPGLDRENFFIRVLKAVRETRGLAGDGTTPMLITDYIVQYL